MMAKVKCPRCEGSGKVIQHGYGPFVRCDYCGGSGVIQHELTPMDQLNDQDALIGELVEALTQAVDALASLRSELEPPLTQVVRGRAAIAKATGAA